MTFFVLVWRDSQTTRPWRLVRPGDLFATRITVGAILYTLECWKVPVSISA